MKEIKTIHILGLISIIEVALHGTIFSGLLWFGYGYYKIE